MVLDRDHKRIDEPVVPNEPLCQDHVRLDGSTATYLRNRIFSFVSASRVISSLGPPGTRLPPSCWGGGGRETRIQTLRDICPLPSATTIAHDVGVVGGKTDSLERLRDAERRRVKSLRPLRVGMSILNTVESAKA